MTDKKKKGKKKIIWYSFFILFLLLVGRTVSAYNQLKPANHFSNVPIVSSNNDISKDNTKSVRIEDPIFNVLLIGSDQRKGQNIGHSDTMMVVNVNLKDYQYNILSIPRDSRVYLDGYGYTKLTSVQYILQNDLGAKKGIEAAVGVISNFTGIQEFLLITM